jgi:hypothetical protein
MARSPSIRAQPAHPPWIPRPLRRPGSGVVLVNPGRLRQLTAVTYHAWVVVHPAGLVASARAGWADD